ncbi:hypothetical protein BOTBODRAFT_191700 [Botryobasidium botryosum FD-172 SS1]|uniref:Cytochrome P450 n=1 Tax=Botryobasidium botryosum (strain FD-172 SS1) TaxID=930990 RepID=A0A067MAE1_BOTB1|nr:hypothetical protein BOTBODRAFT_191700 [Botryobasidium botryosum FD-172 SS1]
MTVGDLVQWWLAHSGALVDIIPILRHIPYWFRGANFERIARTFRAYMEDAVQRPFVRAKADLALRCLPHVELIRYYTPVLARCTPDDITHEPPETFASLQTIALLKKFILAMALYPDVQKRAQAEVGKVIKANAHPTLENRDSMLYISCVLKEVQHWIPVALMGFPHRPIEPDYYDSYFIPEGSVVLPNIWAVTQDEANYKDSKRFWPERFESATLELDPYEYVFGLARSG